MSESVVQETTVMRPPTMDDLAAVVDLINAVSNHEWGADQVDEQFMKDDWQRLGLDLVTDARVIFAPDGEMIAYADVFDEAPHVNPQIWGCVHPDYQGNGVGAYLMDWAETRARQAVDKAEAGLRVAASTGAVNTNETAAGLFAARGYAPVRHFWRMVRDLEDIGPEIPVWPDGITVRPYVPRLDDRFVYQADEEIFADHWGHTPHTFDQWRRIMMGGSFEPSLWLLAVTTESGGNEIAGLALCRPSVPEDPEMGWVGTLGVRRPWRRQGLGLALLQYAFGEFYRRGQKRVGLGVDADSPTGATRLYEKAGMRSIRQWDVYQKILRDGQEWDEEPPAD